MIKVSTSLREFVKRLDNKGANLIIIKDGESIYASKQGGMAPLLEAIDRLGLQTLVGSTVVDKVVGKAAALLISYFKAKDVYTKLLSRRALETLNKHRIRPMYERVVDQIRNREGADICPFEKMVLEIDDPQEGYKKLHSAFRS